MKTREHFDLYVGIPTTREVRACLEETEAAYIRQLNQDYQHGVFTYPFGMDRPTDDPGSEDAGGSIYSHLQVRGESAERAFIHLEAERAYHRAMSELGEVQRRRLELHFFEALSFTEIARREGVTEGAVRHQVKRSLAYLRLQLTGQGYTLSDLLYSLPYAAVPFKTRNAYKKAQKKIEPNASGGNAA